MTSIPQFRAEIISNVGTLGRGYNVSGSQVAIEEDYARRADTYSRGQVRRPGGELVSDRSGAHGNGVAMRSQTLEHRQRAGNGVSTSFVSLLLLIRCIHACTCFSL